MTSFKLRQWTLLLTILISSTASATTELVDTQIALPYGPMADLLQEQIDVAMNGLVRRTDCKKVKSSEYRCGEIPFGTIVDGQKKRVLRITIPPSSGRHDGANYNLSGGSVDLFVYRNQKAGKINLPSLTEKSTVKTPVSSLLGNDVFLKISPEDGVLKQRLCLNMPGLVGWMPPTFLKGRVRKQIDFLPNIDASVKVEVRLGDFDFDSALTCVDLKTQMDDEGLPVITLEQVIDPSFKSLKHRGLEVYSRADVDGIWKFLNKVTKSFGYDIERTIAEQVRLEVLKVAQKEVNVELEDVRNGAWFAQFLGKAHLTRVTEELSNRLREGLKEAGFTRKGIESAAQGLCAAGISDLMATDYEKAALFKLCAFSPKIAIRFFEDDAKDRADGCYSHYFDIRRSYDSKGNRLWWGKSCDIQNRVTISVDDAVAPIAVCLINGWAVGRGPDSACMKKINGLLADLRSGHLDDVLAELTVPPAPSKEELKILRRLIWERTGISIPSEKDIAKLWK